MTAPVLVIALCALAALVWLVIVRQSRVLVRTVRLEAPLRSLLSLTATCVVESGAR